MSSDADHNFLVSSTDATIYAYLRELLCDQNEVTVALIGSGLSIPCGYASWETLVQCLAASADVELQSRDAEGLLVTLKKVYEAYEQEQPGTADGRLLNSVRKCLLVGEANTDSIEYSHLVQTNFSAFLTTNFDPSLSIAMSKVSGHSARSNDYDRGSSFPIVGLAKRAAYYIHGRLWDDDFSENSAPIVLLPEEYSIAYGETGNVSKFLSDVIRNYNLVLFGFGLRDPDVIQVLSLFNDAEGGRLIRETRRDPTRQRSGVKLLAAMVGLPDDEHAEAECMYQHKTYPHLTLIHYKHDTEGQDHWGLRELLRDLANACPAARDTYGDAQVGEKSEPGEPVPVSQDITWVPVVEESHSTVPVEDFSTTLDAVKSILSLDSPTESNVELAISKFEDPTVMDYASQFFAENDDKLGRWFPALLSARLLTVPPPIEERGGMITDGPWYGGRILLIAARLGLPGVEVAMRSIVAPGPNAVVTLVRAYTELPDLALAARLADLTARWFSTGSGVSSAYAHEVGQKVVALSRAGYHNEASLLLRTLLDFENVIDPLVRSARSKVESFWVSHVLNNLVPDMGKSAPTQLLEVLETQLRKIVALETYNIGSYAPPAYLPFPMFVETVEEVGGPNSQLAEQLIAALRDLMEILVEQDISTASSVVARWLEDRQLVFPSLAFYVLSRHGDLMPDIETSAVRKEFLELWYLHHELWTFLRKRFGNLPPKSRQQIEDWILEL